MNITEAITAVKKNLFLINDTFKNQEISALLVVPAKRANISLIIRNAMNGYQDLEKLQKEKVLKVIAVLDYCPDNPEEKTDWVDLDLILEEKKIAV